MLGLFFRPGKTYPVPFGPLRGARLVYDRSVNYHAILGLWEPDTFRMLAEMLTFLKQTRPHLVACDVGANIGMVTLWLSRQLEMDGTVYSFEPSPSVLPKLKQNLLANRAGNVTLVETACSDQTGTVDFFVGFHHHTSSLHQDWAGGGLVTAERVSVNATTLDDYFHRESRDLPDLIKMDIEGGGSFALPGCRKCVAENRPLLLVESHTVAETRAISDLIVGHDYHAYRLENREWVERPEETYPDPKGVWGTLFLCPREHREYFSRKLTRGQRKDKSHELAV
jgi:FkbM family methyltransferase